MNRGDVEAVRQVMRQIASRPFLLLSRDCDNSTYINVVYPEVTDPALLRCRRLARFLISNVSALPGQSTSEKLLQLGDVESFLSVVAQGAVSAGRPNCEPAFFVNAYPLWKEAAQARLEILKKRGESAEAAALQASIVEARAVAEKRLIPELTQAVTGALQANNTNMSVTKYCQQTRDVIARWLPEFRRKAHWTSVVIPG